MKSPDGNDKMTDKPDKQLEAIGKIISLTRNEKLQWQQSNSDKVPRKSNEDIIDSSYTTKYKEQYIRIFRRRFKAPQLMKGFASALSGEKLTENDMRWTSEIILDITGPTGKSLWEFPKEEILNDLLTLIKYKISGAENLINSLLEEQ